MNNDTSAGPALGKVVVGVDGSDHARTAVLWAAAEADRRGRPLIVVHAADTDGRALYASVATIERARETGHDLLVTTAALVEERFPDLRVTKVFSRREPVGSLLEAAGDDGTIVVGNRGLGGFGALMLGSVGLGVSARAKVPVVVVRGEHDRPRLGTVIAAVRGEKDLDWARYAAREAQVREASLRLLTVWSALTQVGGRAAMLDDIDEVAHELVHSTVELADRLRDEFPGLDVTTEVVGGHSVAGRLVEASRDAELYVVGGRRRPIGIGPALGRVTHALLHHAHCPLLVVPADGFPRAAGTGSEGEER
ncbi:universal stress protein [Streptomyces sp. NPDC047928]|uniref:universal stress protein n=1 Tax=unclassified Streptomyces TaxID=2593676 RepID=UPI00371E6C8A